MWRSLLLALIAQQWCISNILNEKQTLWIKNSICILLAWKVESTKCSTNIEHISSTLFLYLKRNLELSPVQFLRCPCTALYVEVLVSPPWCGLPEFYSCFCQIIASICTTLANRWDIMRYLSRKEKAAIAICLCSPINSVAIFFPLKTVIRHFICSNSFILGSYNSPNNVGGFLLSRLAANFLSTACNLDIKRRSTR